MQYKTHLSKNIYTVKKVATFPYPARVSLTNSPRAGLIKLFPTREIWSVTPRLGTGKSLTFFYSVIEQFTILSNMFAMYCMYFIKLFANFFPF